MMNFQVYKSVMQQNCFPLFPLRYVLASSNWPKFNFNENLLKNFLRLKSSLIQVFALDLNLRSCCFHVARLFFAQNLNVQFHLKDIAQNFSKFTPWTI